MAFTEPTSIFTKLTLARQLFAGKYYSEFHENPTCGSVFETD